MFEKRQAVCVQLCNHQGKFALQPWGQEIILRLCHDVGPLFYGFERGTSANEPKNSQKAQQKDSLISELPRVG